MRNKKLIPFEVIEKAVAGQPKTRTLKEPAAARKEGEALPPEEVERLESHKSQKKIARKKLVRQAETGPAAAKSRKSRGALWKCA